MWKHQTAIRQKGPDFAGPLRQHGIELGPVLGEGSFGVAFKGRSLRSGRVFAVKINKVQDEVGAGQLVAHQAAIAALEDAAREGDAHWAVASSKNDKNEYILRFVGGFKLPGSPRMVLLTELADGTLSSLMDDSPGGKVPTKELMLCFEHLAKAIYWILRYGMCHRDLHPGNVFYKELPGGAGKRFKLGDFGMAGKIGEDDGRQGCQPYMAPEVLKGTLCPSSDIWSLFVSIADAAGAVRLQKDFMNEIKNMRHRVWDGWKDCVKIDPRQRPSPREIVVRIKAWRQENMPD